MEEYHDFRGSQQRVERMFTKKSVYISQEAVSRLSILTIMLACLAIIGFVTLAACGQTPPPVQTEPVRLGSTELAQSTPQSVVQNCDLRLLKGTYSFSNSGFAPTPPDGVIRGSDGVTHNVTVKFGLVIPLQATGQVEFDGAGNHKGYIHENVGGIFEDLVPFKGTYNLAPGPNGVGCTGAWVLQDKHKLYPFTEEGPHFFRIVLSRATNGFHYILEGGGPGPAILDGFATLDVK